MPVRGLGQPDYRQRTPRLAVRATVRVGHRPLRPADRHVHVQPPNSGEGSCDVCAAAQSVVTARDLVRIRGVSRGAIGGIGCQKYESAWPPYLYPRSRASLGLRAEARRRVSLYSWRRLLSRRRARRASSASPRVSATRRLTCRPRTYPAPSRTWCAEGGGLCVGTVGPSRLRGCWRTLPAREVRRRRSSERRRMTVERPSAGGSPPNRAGGGAGGRGCPTVAVPRDRGGVLQAGPRWAGAEDDGAGAREWCVLAWAEPPSVVLCHGLRCACPGAGEVAGACRAALPRGRLARRPVRLLAPHPARSIHTPRPPLQS
jgi:hypothetical protein